MAIIGLAEYMRYLQLPSVIDTYMYTTCSKITMAFKRNLMYVEDKNQMVTILSIFRTLL